MGKQWRKKVKRVVVLSAVSKEYSRKILNSSVIDEVNQIIRDAFASYASALDSKSGQSNFNKCNI